MPNIPKIDLAPGFAISRMITGLWQIADMEQHDRILDAHEVVRALIKYQHAGFLTFDMADHYGSAENLAGQFKRAIGPASQGIKLFTKWVPTPQSKRKEDVRNAVGRSLERLGTDQIDLLQYHAWNYADPIWLDHLFWLEELRQEGLITHLGLTNFDAIHLKMALDTGIQVSSNQISFSLLDQRALGQMTDLCNDKGVKILAFGTLAGGFLSDKWIGITEPPADKLQTWSQMKYKRYIDVTGGWQHFQSLLRLLKGIGQRSNASIAQIAARFILDQPAVAAIIIGARLGESEHIEENAKVFDIYIGDADRQQLAALTSSFLVPGNCGDEYRKPPFLTAKGDLSDHISSMPAPYPIRSNAKGHQLCNSKTIWEDVAGFSRAIKTGNRIFISGTTATHGNRLIGGSDPASQTHFIIDKIEGALQSLGSEISDVIRTRIYIRDSSLWEPISRAHGQRFKNILPANTLIRADLIGEGYLVEIEAEALSVE